MSDRRREATNSSQAILPPRCFLHHADVGQVLKSNHKSGLLARLEKQRSYAETEVQHETALGQRINLKTRADFS